MVESIKLEYFANRREKLLKQIDSNSIVIIPSNKEILRNGDATYHFRQDSNFYYLTGFNEPNSVAVLIKGDSDNKNPSSNDKFILFVRPRDPAKEQWDGLRAGIDGAVSKYGADNSYEIDDLDKIIVDNIKNKSKVYYDLGSSDHYDNLVTSWLNQVKTMQRTGVASPKEVVNISNFLSEMRLFKDEYEQFLMRKAAVISAAAHTKAIEAACSSEYEHELEAELVYECVKHGARQQAYNPIVGSGSNTCILHYGDNNNKLDKNGLVLIDAGAEYQHYAADITRTFPANGKFSQEQKLIYELVLKAQQEAIETIKPGNKWSQAQQVIVKIITEGLVELGLIKSDSNDINSLIKQEAYKKFYMHNSGHWLGIDVHDVGSYKVNNKWRDLEPGMVLTVEPGIYIMANLPGVDKKWWNIGVRIEDDVLVTEFGHEVLTKGVPKQISEIEQLMANG